MLSGWRDSARVFGLRTAGDGLFGVLNGVNSGIEAQHGSGQRELQIGRRVMFRRHHGNERMQRFGFEHGTKRREVVFLREGF